MLDILKAQIDYSKKTDWNQRLDKYLEPFISEEMIEKEKELIKKDGLQVIEPKDNKDENQKRGYRSNTHKTYKSWLTPFVKHLNEEGVRNPTPQFVKEYLEKNWGNNPAVYNRIGKQIISFLNEFLNRPI